MGGDGHSLSFKQEPERKSPGERKSKSNDMYVKPDSDSEMEKFTMNIQFDAKVKGKTCWQIPINFCMGGGSCYTQDIKPPCRKHNAPGRRQGRDGNTYNLQVT